MAELKARKMSINEARASRRLNEGENFRVAGSDCDLEVEINGLQTFYLNKKIIVSWCGYFDNVLKSTSSIKRPGRLGGRCQRVSLFEFPGGIEGFEMAARFCYNEGQLRIDPSNVLMLRVVGFHLQMTEEFFRGNLITKTTEYLRNLGSWELSDIVAAITGCDRDDLRPLAELMGLIQRCVYVLAGKIALKQASVSGASPPRVSTSSPDYENFTLDSTCFTSNSSSWWFDEVSGLSLRFAQKLARTLAASAIDHRVLSKFLLHYLKRSLAALGYRWASPRQGKDELIQMKQLELLETIVDLLYELEPRSTTCKSLFILFRMAVLMRCKKQCRSRIEQMLGAQLDLATLDSILIPPVTKEQATAHDTDLVQRLLTHFVNTGYEQAQLVKVVRLLDCYLLEIAPDPNLDISRFMHLARTLHPSAKTLRGQEFYAALDVYLQAHPCCEPQHAKALRAITCESRLAPQMSRVRWRFPLETSTSQTDDVLQQPCPGAPLAPAQKQNEQLKSDPRECKKPLLQNDQLKEEAADFDKVLFAHHKLRTGIRDLRSRLSHLEKTTSTIRAQVVDTVTVRRGFLC